ncbi:MAG: hypothetical protein H0W68_12240 [Gemmatimonadaceae bacterium]|nr:hypothetical protein [Geodermatophilaceae bacterium]MBA3672775.1 hypothetical protein [Gemmatimonadaceae bacterium]
MRHFYRSHRTPAEVLAVADRHFASIGFSPATTTTRARSFTSPLGALRLVVKPEGGHYTFIEATTDQMGESRMDRNVKRFFVELHRADDPSHALDASY